MLFENFHFELFHIQYILLMMVNEYKNKLDYFLLFSVLILIFIAVATVIFVFVDHAKLQLNILSNKYNQKNAATSSEIGGLLDYELFMDKLGFIDQYVDLFFYY